MSNTNKGKPSETSSEQYLKHGYQPAGDGGVITGGYIPKQPPTTNQQPPTPPSGGSSQQDE